jgi:hypothetical protein
MTKLFATSGDTTFIIDVPGGFPHISHRVDDEPFYFVRIFPKIHYDVDSVAFTTKAMLELQMGSESFSTFSFFKKAARDANIENFRCKILDSEKDIIAVVLVVPHACPNCAA